MVAASVGECAVSVVSEPISTMRDAAQLEAVIAGLAKVAWSLPAVTDAMSAFGKLISAAKVYMQPGS
eukprot:482348-Prymnesium_polylepis.1